jgi:MFS-type transporter involved in bile tolerance (Atg22 family)
MGRQLAVVLYVVAMVAIIVGVDFLFLRHRFWERLIVNIGIVLMFAAFYLTFLRRPGSPWKSPRSVGSLSANAAAKCEATKLVESQFCNAEFFEEMLTYCRARA